MYKFWIQISVLLLLVGTVAEANTKTKPKSRFRNSTQHSAPQSAGKDYNVIKEDGHKVMYKKKNVVDFDDSLIEGEVKNPSEFYFVHRPEEKFGNLVKKRKDFHKEMLRDTVMIR